jgi:Ala-tRNA(Pro) deacylase
MAVPQGIASYLASRGISFDAISHAEALSSIDEARALGVEADEVAKVIVVRHAGGWALVALPASARTDMRAVRAALGDSRARFASEGEMAERFPEYALGAVPPLVELVGAPLFLDRHLAEDETVVFAAGTHTDSIRMAVGDLRGLAPHELVEACRARE